MHRHLLLQRTIGAVVRRDRARQKSQRYHWPGIGSGVPLLDPQNSSPRFDLRGRAGSRARFYDALIHDLSKDLSSYDTHLKIFASADSLQKVFCSTLSGDGEGYSFWPSSLFLERYGWFRGRAHRHEKSMGAKLSDFLRMSKVKWENEL